MRATQALPVTYRKIGTLDVTANKWIPIILNLIGLFLTVISGWVFLRAMVTLRPDDSVRVLRFEISSLTGGVVLIAAILGLTALHVLLHEAIHGVFFWLFTRSRPRFAFRWAYAYAAAPDWYIPRTPFLITTLAPLIVMTLTGLALFLIVPAALLVSIWFIITMNAGGAIGDLIVAAWLLLQPPTCLAQDRGDAVTLYVPN